MTIETMTCMNCGTEVANGLCHRGDEHTNIPHEDRQACDVKISGGYSSDFDLCEFHGVICTPCLRKALPNLYKVANYEQPMPKFHYFPKGVDAARNWRNDSGRTPQEEQRMIDELAGG